MSLMDSHTAHTVKNLVATLAPPCWYTYMRPFGDGYLISVGANMFLGWEIFVQNEINGLCEMAGKDTPVVLQVDKCYCCRLSGLDSTLDDESVDDFLYGLTKSENIHTVLIYSSEGMEEDCPKERTNSGGCAWTLKVK